VLFSGTIIKGIQNPPPQLRGEFNARGVGAPAANSIEMNIVWQKTSVDALVFAFWQPGLPETDYQIRLVVRCCEPK
jgi:hypothetical protein